LVGRIDLVPVDPPRYGIGYWLARVAVLHRSGFVEVEDF
jgi:hypothetical protein